MATDGFDKGFLKYYLLVMVCFLLPCSDGDGLPDVHKDSEEANSTVNSSVDMILNGVNREHGSVLCGWQCIS